MIDAQQIPEIVRHAIDGEKPAIDLLLSLADWLQLQPHLPLGAAGTIQFRYQAYSDWLQTQDEGMIVNLDGVY